MATNEAKALLYLGSPCRDCHIAVERKKKQRVEMQSLNLLLHELRALASITFLRNASDRYSAFYIRLCIKQTIDLGRQAVNEDKRPTEMLRQSTHETKVQYRVANVAGDIDSDMRDWSGCISHIEDCVVGNPPKTFGAILWSLHSRLSVQPSSDHDSNVWWNSYSGTAMLSTFIHFLFQTAVDKGLNSAIAIALFLPTGYRLSPT